ncbi:hypothetical protein HN358_00285 [Candidatus Uhrbacteria bacterium]|nr:hypothetical protein [Candidatus Uhrbacteria bacterium]MBT7717720.1 hypothetical protein [Candidatus Uhrbacteria bacterium]
MNEVIKRSLNERKRGVSPESGAGNEQQGVARDYLEDSEIPERKHYTPESICAEFEVPKDFPRNASEVALFDMASDILIGTGDEVVSDTEFVYIEQFMRRLVDIEPEERSRKERDMISTIEERVDSVLTEKLRGLLAYGDDSILVEQRKKLGIDSEDDEQRFDVRIISLQEAGDDYEKRQELWVELSGGSPSLFIMRNQTLEGVLQDPTIYLSEDHLKRFLQEDYPDQAFLHEYRHTQRSFSYGSDQLFRFLDEVTTDVGEYENISSQLRLLTLTAEEMEYRAFFNAYEKDDDEAKADLLRQLAHSFGPMGLMVLGGKPSSEHSGDRDGIKDLPLFEVNGPQRNDALQFFETMLAFREKQDPNWIEVFRKRLQDKEGDYRAFLDILRSYLFRETTIGLEESDADRTRQLVDVIDAEMERRRILGEGDFDEVYMKDE